jgi:hypothetical protein
MHQKAILLSKLSTALKKKLPSIKKIIFYFLINLKTYKKGELLLFIALALIFRGLQVRKYTEFRSIQVFRVVLHKCAFLKMFVWYYLPTLGLQENYIQSSLNQKSRQIILQMTYKSMLCLPEFDEFYSSYDLVFTILASYRVLLSIYMEKCALSSGIETLVRFYRLPCRVL